ncbi:GAF domain-containing sensor histidine kinase [Bradyrhizobium liaoningense]|uniref:GAF domain-containing sensor histidine kinase n=1 Tax=Bradyrhizobium liaoningense TaxID=43992 RepID=UPI001BA9EFF1|nr:GAF domain-containing sensor histidine kinase [Bradyrhizobium liaoningense]MBR0713648.1 PAS domain S-box protein [Bradyrhizobium liaoningense]
MIETTQSTNYFPVEASVPPGAVSLEAILCTEELRRRPWRPPDHEKENRALVALAGALVESPSNILQTLAEIILDVTQCDSSGLSLLTKDDGGKRFYWPAIAGEWKRHIGRGTPRDFGPCGDVLDQNRTLLFRHFELRYPYFIPITPAAEECLLVPFYIGGKAVGTIWAITHGERRKFDSEDERIMNTLGQFASVAYQTVESIEDLKLQIAARQQAETALRALASGLEAKIRRLVNANIIGIFIWSFDGRIIDANEAFLRIVGYGRDDLVSGRLLWKELTPAEWRNADERRVRELETTGTAKPYEKEYFHKNGDRVPVLVGGATFEEKSDEGVAFVLDLTDRKRAEAAVRESERRYSEVQNELAHANRVATMGQLLASIAHEINQPIGASINSANAALNFLRAQPPDLEEVQLALAEIVKIGFRTGNIIDRIRALVKKSPPRKDSLDINSTVLEIAALSSGEMSKNGISVQTQLAESLPAVQGDRVQIQQVLLNLFVNAAEAMSRTREGPKELMISTGKDGSEGVLVAVRDSGPGLTIENTERVFDAFYTTKASGLGMGLSICRSIIEAHQGQLWAAANVPRGAVFQFTLPVYS